MTADPTVAPSPTNGSGDDASPSGGASTGDRSFSYRAELKRKALHILALVVPLGMGWLGTAGALTLLLPATLLAVGADVLRAFSPTFSRWIQTIFGPLMRAEEVPPVGTRVVLNGATCVLIGASLLTLLFPVELAAPLFAMVMVADAAAALVGRRFGRHAWPGTSHTAEGTLAFVLVGTAVVAAVPALSATWATFGIAVVGVVAAAVVEAAALPFNDNIRVPLVSTGVVCLAHAWVLGEPVEWGVFALSLALSL